MSLQRHIRFDRLEEQVNILIHLELVEMLRLTLICARDTSGNMQQKSIGRSERERERAMSVTHFVSDGQELNDCARA